MKLVSRQYSVEDEEERNLIIDRKKEEIERYISILKTYIDLKDLRGVQTTLQDMFLEEIGDGCTEIWVNRIINNETTLENFKRLYLLMADYGFRPYHT